MRWSPDGKAIAYSETGTWAHLDTEIWVMKADGTNKQLIKSFHSTGMICPPKWSPDGTRIACPLPDDTGQVWLSLINPDTGGETHLLKDVVYYWWCPDGNKILFEHEGGLYLLNLEEPLSDQGGIPIRQWALIRVEEVEEQLLEGKG